MAAKKKVTDQYRDPLTKVGKSPHFVRAYSHDLAAFARWFEQTTGEDLPLTPETSRSAKAT